MVVVPNNVSLSVSSYAFVIFDVFKLPLRNFDEDAHMFNLHVVKFINNSQELGPINRQYLSHMCTSVNPYTNQLGLTLTY